MTVTTTTIRNGPYYPNGATLAFPFTFRALDKNDIQVIRVSADGAVVYLSNALFDVALTANGGTALFAIPPLAGDPLYVQLNPAFSQEISLENEGAFLPEVISEALDRGAQRSLWLRDRVLSVVPDALASAAARAGRFLSWGPDGAPQFSSGTGSDSALRFDLAGYAGSALIGLRYRAIGLTRAVQSALDERFPTPADFSIAANDDDLIDALLASAASTIRIPRRSTAYSLSRTHVVPAGKTVLFDGYTTIVWAGINDSTLRGVFDVSAAGIKIGVYGTGKVAFSCATAAPFVYAFQGYASVALSIADVFTLNMSAVFVSANAGSYAAVVTPKMRAAGDARPLNIVQGPEITGCSVLFSVTQSVGNGGIYLGYTFDGIVTDCHVNGANQGIQWWGGNANRSVDGALVNERKCQNIRIRMCSAANIGGGGIWGSMGQNNRVENSDVTIAGDVGFDDEGGVGNKFVACAVRESAHGNYTVFFDSQNTQIINCNSYQSDASKPHLRTYNSALDGIPSGLAVDGGLWETAKEAGRPGMLDAANGPNRVVIIRNIKGINTAITLNTNNRNITTIENNDLAFPYLSSVAFTAIYLDGAHTVTSSDGAPVAAQEIVRSNRVYTDYAQPTNTYAILLRVGDFNNIVTAEVSGNILSSGANVWWGEILFTSTGTNPGNPPHCIARDNRLSTVSTGLINIGFNAASGAVAPVQHLGVNTNRYGVPLS